MLRQVFFEDVVARRRRAQLKWDETPIESIFSDQSDLLFSFPRVLCCVFGHVLQQKGMHSTDAFDFFDCLGNGTLQAVEVFRMFKWAGITANARQILSFFLAVDSDHNDQIDLSEFMVALRLPACSPKEAALASECRKLIKIDAEERADINRQIHREMQNLEREKRERDQLVLDLRERQEQRTHTESSENGVPNGQDQEANPAVSTSNARYQSSLPMHC